ncbi:uncharacterized protein LOC119307619 [Triticum dicoccoides]|uniref:uncharacterized protein LOC119307619 n=1 Tax=Triticum dicoccoides TaxID=85692 RepID=UPI00189038A4|nr:uncharacterized protein LOC119307619 [Triticum dicoccoides]
MSPLLVAVSGETLICATRRYSGATPPRAAWSWPPCNSIMAPVQLGCGPRAAWKGPLSSCRRRDEEIRQSAASGWRLPLSSSSPTPEQQQEDGVAVKCASVCSSVGAFATRDAGGSPLSVTCLHLPSIDDDSVEDDTTTSRGGAPPPAPVQFTRRIRAVRSASACITGCVCSAHLMRFSFFWCV